MSNSNHSPFCPFAAAFWPFCPFKPAQKSANRKHVIGSLPFNPATTCARSVLAVSELASFAHVRPWRLPEPACCLVTHHWHRLGQPHHSFLQFEMAHQTGGARGARAGRFRREGNNSCSQTVAQLVFYHEGLTWRLAAASSQARPGACVRRALILVCVAVAVTTPPDVA